MQQKQLIAVKQEVKLRVSSRNADRLRVETIIIISYHLYKNKKAFQFFKK
jgi:hypothetical protein